MIVDGIYKIAHYFHSCISIIISAILEMIIYLIALPFVIIAIPVDLLFPYDEDDDDNTQN